MSTESDDGIAAMRRLIGGHIQLLTDPDGQTLRKFQLADCSEAEHDLIAIPAIYLIDRTGIIRYHYVSREAADRPRIELLMLAAEHVPEIGR